MYKELTELGYLTGGPNAWNLTEEGRKHGEERFKETGKGRACVKGYHYLVWDEELAYDLGDPDAWQEFVNSNRKAAGLPPVKW